MKNIITIFLILLCINILNAREKIVPENIYETLFPEYPNRKEKLYLRKAIESNFTNSKDKEVTAFYYWKHDNKDYSLYQKIKIYIINGEGDLQNYSSFESVFDNYSKIELIPIKELEPVFGSWNGYYYSYDLNKNGVNEIILFPFGGTGLSLSIYEFRKDRMFPVLKLEDGIRVFHISVDVKEKAVSIYHPYEYEAHKKGYIKRTYKWNVQKGLYEMVKKQEEVEFK